MVSSAAADETSLMKGGCDMTRNDGFRPFLHKEESSAKSQTAAFRQEMNRPVPLDAFDRERMGLAAKE
jgi:hypothetical protein